MRVTSFSGLPQETSNNISATKTIGTYTIGKKTTGIGNNARTELFFDDIATATHVAIKA
jgi:hypothetical protein